jgi:hypothetical protein
MTRGRPFVKGQSGNPGGRSKEVGHVRELARQHTEEAIETLVSIMRDDGQPGRSRAAAAEALLNRGWGSPTQHVEMEVREQPPLLPYTDEELLARLQALVDEKRERAKRVH